MFRASVAACVLIVRLLPLLYKTSLVWFDVSVTVCILLSISSTPSDRPPGPAPPFGQVESALSDRLATNFTLEQDTMEGVAEEEWEE